MYTQVIEVPIGRMTMASDGESLVGLWLEGQKYFARTIEDACEERRMPVFARTEEWLAAYFSGENPPVDIPLAPRGSAFQQEVWGILRTIPYGEVLTYGDIARMIADRQGADRMAAQAVGGAVGHNPISIIIPCHRVVGRDGSLSGYAGGVSVKQRLLELEGVDRGDLFVPAKERPL